MMRWFAWVVLLGVVACKGGGEGAVRSEGGKVAVKVDESGFAPSSIEVKKGVPTQLIFTRTSDSTCATEVVFPDLNVTKELPLNTPVAITVPTDVDRTLVFQCGMGMYRSKLVIKP